MTRNKLIILVLFLGMASPAYAQQDSLTCNIFNAPRITEYPARLTSFSSEVYNPGKSLDQLFEGQISRFEKPTLLMRTPALGWFCQKELLLEEKTGLPIRFRVGTYQAAARLEGK